MNDIEHILIEIGDVNALDYLMKNTELILNKEDNALQSYVLSAATEGKLKMIEYLYAKDLINLSSDLMFCAINGDGCETNEDKMDFVKYLHEIDCPWDERAYHAAIDENDWNIIRYLYENNCPLTEKVVKFSIKQRKHEITKFLLENGCPINKKCLNRCTRWYSNDIWFQKYLYIEHNVINNYTLHIRHKIQRIQKAWFVYSLNPTTKKGAFIMHNELSKLPALT